MTDTSPPSSAASPGDASLPRQLAEAPLEARARALAKAARVLSRLRPDQPLRGHTERAGEALDEDAGEDEGDAQHQLLRRIVVRQAYNDDRAALRALATSLLSSDQDDGGARWLLRALSNLRSVDSRAASTLAVVVVEALRPAVDGVDFARTLAKLLPAIRRETSFTARLLELAAEALRAPYADPSDVRTWLLQELVATDLRLEADSDHLVRKRGPLRPVRLREATRDRLEKTLADTKAEWSRRAAAIWLLGAADVRGMERAMAASEEAYRHFPLEALGAVEQVQCAYEYEASERVDELRVAGELQQLRQRAGSELGRAAGEAVAAALLGSVQSAVAGELPRDAAALMASVETLEPVEALSRAALLDARIRQDLVARLRNTGSLAEAAAPIFALEGLSASAGAVAIATALLGALGEVDPEAFDSWHVVWEQAAAGEEHDSLASIARQVVVALRARRAKK